MDTVPRSSLAAAALTLASVLWGAGFMLGKLSLRDLTVAQTVLYRFAIGSAVLLIPVIARREWLRTRDVPYVCAAGVIGVPVTYLLQFEALDRTSGSEVALLAGTLPALFAAAGIVLRGERPSLRTLCAIAISIAGIALFCSGSVRAKAAGTMLVMLSLCGVIAWTLMSKRLLEHYSAAATTAWVVTAGTIALLPITIARDGALPLLLAPRTWAVVVASGVLCTGAAYLLWNAGLQRVTVSRAGVFTNIETAVGLLLGTVYLGDRLTPAMIAGGILTGTAALLVAAPDT